MKTSSSTLIAALFAASASVAFAAPGNQYWTDADHMVYGPKVNPAVVKVNPGVLKQHGNLQVGNAAQAAGATQMGDGYCGNGIKPIPGLGGGGGVGPAGGTGFEGDWCGTRVPGRIPGVGPGPRPGVVNTLPR
jgi:hypothetical protein